MEEVEVIITAISGVGFPAVMSILLLRQNSRLLDKLDKLEETVTRLSAILRGE